MSESTEEMLKIKDLQIKYLWGLLDDIDLKSSIDTIRDIRLQ